VAQQRCADYISFAQVSVLKKKVSAQQILPLFLYARLALPLIGERIADTAKVSIKSCFSIAFFRLLSIGFAYYTIIVRRHYYAHKGVGRAALIFLFIFLSLRPWSR